MRAILLFNLVILSLVGCGETNQQKAKEQTEQVINDTLEIVRQRNEHKSLVDSMKGNLKSVQRDIYGQSAEGGSIESFYNQSDTLKKEIVYYGEIGKRIIQIYQRQGNPLLVEDTEIRYKEPISAEKDIEISSRITNVYYLDDNQHLIHWLNDGSEMPESQYKIQEEKIIMK
jgi:hypothetical protein